MADTGPPEAIARALPLLDASVEGDTTAGYLDLLGGTGDDPSGPIQAFWESRIGTAVYEPFQALLRGLTTLTRLPESALRLPRGGRALDVGCGPGNVTAQLGRVVGADGLALGVDVSAPMLRRAVSQSAANVGFMRADAQRLPFHDATFDAVTSLLILQLVPDPRAALEEMGRVLVPGGTATLLIPTVRGTFLERIYQKALGAAKLHFFGAGELAGALRAAGFSTVHTHQRTQVLWVFATKDEP